MTTGLSQLHARITDLQLKIDDLRKSSLDPKDALMEALKELHAALEDLDVAHEELCQQDESLQSAYLTIESERQRYLELFNSAPDGYLVTDLTGVIREANLAASDLLRSGLIGMPISAFFDEENIDGWLDRLKRDGLVRDLEVSIRKPDGTKLPVVISASTTSDARGDPCGLLWQVHNITKRKKAEERLAESEEKYRRLVESINEVIYYLDDQGVIKYISPAIERLTGYRPAEVMGRNFEEFLPEEDRAVQRSAFKRVLFGEIVSYDLRVVTAFGDARWLRSSSRPALKDSRAVGISGILADITEIKRAESALHENLCFLQRLMDTIPNPIFYKGRSGLYLGCNRAFEDFLGLKKDEIAGRSVYELSPKDLADKYYEMDEALFHSPGVQVYETEVQDADGTIHDVIFNKATYTDVDGAVAGLVGVILDITERKQAEEIRERLVKELESKNSEMERFIYTVSHDLRSPLVTINGFVGFLKSDLSKGSSERVDIDIRMIGMAIIKMESLLNDTLELSRIGRVANPPEAVPFSEIAREAADQIREKIRARGIRLEIEPDLPSVNVDRMRIVEVLTNLIENSVKYMGDQPDPEIWIGCRFDGGENVFFVKDNGMGIDKSQHDKVFGLFYKVNKKSEGSGAGLAIVKRIIEVHGGRIWVESGSGLGCAVCFTLPEAA
ncbi:MAG TPA: PAS domain S-box protein [Methanotrichaceae archaeon]|nr:PAS domain S-box protein [Methanotrichaceae archaeon]